MLPLPLTVIAFLTMLLVAALAIVGGLALLRVATAKAMRISHWLLLIGGAVALVIVIYLMIYPYLLLERIEQ